MKKYAGIIDVTILTSTYEEAAEWISENKAGVNVYAILGSTFCNMFDFEIKRTFDSITKYMKNGEFFMFGMDLLKDPRVISKAYDQPNYPTKGSPQGMTNIHNILGGSLAPSCFYTHQFYDPVEKSFRDFIVSKKKQTLKIRDREFSLEEHEPILTFFSRKMTIKMIEELLAPFGLKLVAHFEDSKNYFSSVIFKMARDDKE